jgi:iron-sulfur cluster repair protein YtfE (RIC family)
MAERPDVIDLLTEDHRRLERLLDRLDATDDPQELRAIYLQLVGELAAHEACEQHVVFPALRRHLPAGRADLGMCQAEHEEINELIDEMRDLPPSGLAFVKRASALGIDLVAHFADEELLFARLRAIVAPDELEALAEPAQWARHNAPAFPPAQPLH